LTLLRGIRDDIFFYIYWACNARSLTKQSK
jgi:hypothetical protein